MKRFLLALAVALGLLPTPARAGVVCTLPITLQNGTVADASQVMANFNAITACLLGNIAASGANNDITGLFALTTPIAPINGGTPIYVGSNSGGSPNAQTISSTVPLNFALTSGRMVAFVAGSSSTAAMTLNVSGTGAVAVKKRTSSGLISGSVTSGNAYVVMYDGTQWQILNQSADTPTTQRFISGGGTYTTAIGASWLDVILVGAGGGGSGSGSGGAAGGDTCWNTTGAACTAALYNAGGGGGGNSPGGTGGTVGGTGVCTDGTNGSDGMHSVSGSGPGGASTRGGAGGKNNGGAGANAAPNSGSGGEGASGFGGGGAGATCRIIITNPAATYTYAVGAKGNGGSGTAGGDGGDGNILVIEHYN